MIDIIHLTVASVHKLVQRAVARVRALYGAILRLPGD